MRLRDQPWWPSTWPTPGDHPLNQGELSQNGTFVTARLSSNGITLAIDYNGVQYKALIPSEELRKARPDDRDFLGYFCGILGRYRQKPFHEDENIEFDSI